MEKNLDIQISEQDVPMLIQEQFIKMNDCKANIALARQKADLAYQQAIENKKKKKGLFSVSKNLESLQKTQMSLSEATLSNTLAAEKSFEYQKTLAEVTKYLFGLGVTNIAMNRCVVKELSMRLENASEEEIDALAKDEIKNVVTQLKNQEDLMLKQLDLTERVKDHALRINELNDDLIHKDLKINKLSDDIKILEDTIDIMKKESKKSKIITTIFMILLMIISISSIILQFIL